MTQEHNYFGGGVVLKSITNSDDYLSIHQSMDGDLWFNTANENSDRISAGIRLRTYAGGGNKLALHAAIIDGLLRPVSRAVIDQFNFFGKIHTDFDTSVKDSFSFRCDDSREKHFNILFNKSDDLIGMQTACHEDTFLCDTGNDPIVWLSRHEFPRFYKVTNDYLVHDVWSGQGTPYWGDRWRGAHPFTLEAA